MCGVYVCCCVFTSVCCYITGAISSPEAAATATAAATSDNFVADTDAVSGSPSTAVAAGRVTGTLAAATSNTDTVGASGIEQIRSMVGASGTEQIRSMYAEFEEKGIE